MAITLTTSYQLISSFNITYGAIRTYAKYSSQSKENNQTYYQLKQVYYCSQSGGYTGINYGLGTLDGSQKEYTSYTRFYYGETLIQEVERTLNHNADGSSPTKNVATSWSASFGGGGSTSVDIVMPKIDRYPMLTGADNFNDEGNPTITYSTTLGFSGASVQACIANTTGGVIYVPYRAVNVSNGSYTFSLTNEERATLRNATPNSNYLNVKFYLRTTTTNNVSYYSVLERQMSIINGNPTFTHTEAENNQKVIDLIGSGATSVIQNASNLSFSIVPTALKGASIKSVSITHNNITNTINTSGTANFALSEIVNGDFTIRVTDTRNNYTTEQVTKTLIEYMAININSYSFRRYNPTSSNVVLTLESDYIQKTINNVANVPIVKWKLDDGSYTTIPSTEYTIDTTNNLLTINYTLSNALVYTSAGQFSVSVEDFLTSDIESDPRGYVTKGVATTEKGEHDFQVNGSLYIADTSRQNKGEVFPNIYSTTERVVGTWIDDKPLYRKTFDTGTLPNATSKTVSTGLSGVKVRHIYGTAIHTNGTTIPLPYVSISTTNMISIAYTSTNYISIDTSSTDRSGYTTSYITLEYTKTTD